MISTLRIATLAFALSAILSQFNAKAQTASTGLNKPETARSTTPSDSPEVLKALYNGGYLDGLKPGDEDVSLRNATSKHFRNEDGTMTAIMGAGDLHYKENGEWKTILPHILPNVGGTRGEYGLAALHNGHKMYFPTTPGMPVVAEVRGMVYEDWGMPAMVWLAADGTVLGEYEANTVSTASVDEGEMSFSGIFPGVDAVIKNSTRTKKLNYLMNDSSVLGDVPYGATHLAFREQVRVSLGARIEGLSEVGSINGVRLNTLLFKDETGKPQVEVFSPVFHDKISGGACTDVDFVSDAANPDAFIEGGYLVRAAGPSTYEVFTLVPLNWLSAPERRFPLVIDPVTDYYPGFTWPTYTAYRSGNSGNWACNSGAYANRTYPNSDISYGWVDTTWPTNNPYLDGYASFNVTALPDNACVSAVSYHWYRYGGRTCGDAIGLKLGMVQSNVNLAQEPDCNITGLAVRNNNGYYAGTGKNGTGWQSQTGNVTNLVAALPSNQITIGWAYNGGDDCCSFLCAGDDGAYHNVYGFEHPSRKPYARVTYETQSVAPTGITASSNPICPGSSTTLTVSGGSLGSGASWNWYSGSCGGTFLGTGTSINVSPSVNTTYYVRAIGPCNTTSCASVTVTLNSNSTAPTSASASSPTICVGQSTTLSFTGGSLGTGASWQWYSGSCGGASAGSGTSVNVSPTVTTTYYVRAVGTCNTTICRSVTVTVNTLSVAPTSITASTNPICNGGSTTLTRVGGSLGTGAGWVWYSGSCGGTPVGTGNSISVSPSSNTTYYVRAEGTCNTTACASLAVTVNTLSTAPTSASTSASLICEGASVTLSRAGGSLGTGANWEWYSGSCGGTFVGTGSSISVTPTATTTYYVRAEGTCNTTACQSVTVTVNTLSTAPTSINASANPVCNGTSTTLNRVGGSLGTGATWVWYTGSCGGTQVATGTSLTVSPSTTTTYYLRAEGTCNNTLCASVTIVVNPIPVLTVNNTAPVLCPGQQANISLSSNVGGTFNWTASGSNGFVGGFSSGPGSSPIQHTLTNSGSASATVTYSNITATASGCSSAPQSTSVTVHPSPNGSITGTSTVCEAAPTTLTFNFSTATGPFNVQYSDGTTTFSLNGISSGHTISVSPSTTTTYSLVLIADANSCSRTSGFLGSATVSVNQSPNGSISLSSPICQGDQTTLTFNFDAGTGPFTATVTDGISQFPLSGLNSGSTYVVTPPTSVTYSFVSITDALGCTRTSGFSGSAQVIVNPLPSVSFTGLASAYCQTSGAVTLTGNQAPNGTFSGAGVTDNGNGTATFNPAVAGVGGPYSVTYSFTDINSCSSANTQTVTVDQQPVADAGTATTQCDLDVTLAAQPSVGSGLWSATGPGSVFFNNATSATSGVQVDAYGTYTFTWTEVNGTCSDADQLTVTFTEQPVANAGQGGSECDLDFDLAAIASVGSGTWSFVSGPGSATFGSAGSASTTVTVTQFGQYVFEWEEVNGTCSDAAAVTVDFYQQPSTNAGFGGAECDLDFGLAATASVGTGTWTSSGPGSAIFTPNANDPNATVNVSAYGSYTFTWTEVNGTCSDAASVSVTFDEATTADAGVGGSECDQTFTFNGTSGLGTGVWSYTGPGNAFFSDNASPTATVTVDTDGAYIFTWTQTNGVCSAQDQVTVTFYNQPAANAGQGGDACDLDFQLSAVPTYGTGVWTQSGGSGTSSFDDATSPTAIATVSQYGTYQFTWTETNGTCSDASSVTVNFYQQPVANAGSGGDECDLDFNLAAIPSVGSGAWTAAGPGSPAFGNASTASTTVTVSQYGTYQFTWTETNGTCTDAASVTVNFYEQPTANAGQDGDACVLNYQLAATLSTGSGVWTQTSGAGNATFNDATSPSATATVDQNDTYVFTWTETNGTCTDADAVTVNFWNQPTANAGSDMQECDLDVALNAVPSLGTGQWTASGPGIVTFVSDNSANTTATVTQYGSYTFTWTETNGTCVSSDNMIVEFFEQPVANAGQGGDECDFNFTFNGTASVGTGVWTSFGPGTAFFSNVNSPVSGVTVDVFGTYTFTWTEINGPCTDAASVTVNFYEQPVADAGTVSDQCDLDFTFNGNASVGTGTWTANGPGTASFSDVNDANASVTVSLNGAYDFTWTEVNGTCSDAETVSITFNPLPVVSFSGLAPDYCVSQTSTVALTGTPAGGQFSGAGIAGNVFIPSVAGVGTHDITYTYTDANGCTDSQTQSVVVNDSPVVSFTGLASAYCASVSSSQPLTGTPAGGTFSGNGISGSSFTPSAAGLGSHFITYDYTDANGCSGSYHQMVVVNPLPVVSFTGLNAAYCVDAAAVTLIPAPAGGTYTGNGVSGTQFNPSVAGVGTHDVTYTYTDGNGCQNSVTQSVTINALPQPIITPSGTQTICAGDAVTLDAGQGYSIYAWSTNENGQTISVGQAGQYTVTVTTAQGCTATSAAVQVNVNTLPLVDIGNDTTICQGTFLTLDAGNPGLSYEWSTQENTQQITVGSTGNYTVEVTDANGCVGTDSRLVAVSSSLNPVIVAQGPTTFCDGESVTLASEGTYSAYLWSNNTQGPSTTVGAAGPVILTVTDQFGCSGSSAPLNITVNQLPNAVITPSGSTNLCQGASVTLSASNTFSNYLWNPNGEVTPTITVSTAGTYSLTVTDPINGCVATSNSIVVTQSVGVQPTIIANGPLEFCAGGNVVLSVIPANAFTSFLWTSGSNTQSITVTESGEYAVSVLDANNCLNESLLANPVVVTVWDPTPIVQQQGSTLVVTNGPFSSYQWFINGNPIPGATADSFVPGQSGNIRVQVTDENGCTGNSLIIEYTSVGIADVQDLYDLNVYPNPNGGQFTVEADLGSHTDVTLSLRDMVGRELMQVERIKGASSFRRTFDISHLANGIYFIRVDGDEGMIVKRVIKQ